MASRNHSPSASTGAHRHEIDLTLSDSEDEPSQPASKSPKKGSYLDTILNNDDGIDHFWSRIKSNSKSQAQSGQNTQVPSRPRISALEVVDLTFGSPDPESKLALSTTNNKVLQDVQTRQKSPSNQHIRHTSVSRSKTDAPGRAEYPIQVASPNKRARHDVLDTSIDDSKATMSDVEMPDVKPSPPQETKIATAVQFDPLPAFTFEPPSDLAPVSKAFTDWKPPDVPLDYSAISKVWERNHEEFKEDHARFACDKLERARMHNERAEQACSEAHQELNYKTASTQSDPLWYEAPATSTTIGASKSSDTFTFVIKPCHKSAHVTKLFVDMSSFEPKAVTIPHFRTYYPIRRSQLVQSDRDLLFWPEATEQDNLSEDEIKHELKGQFHFRMVTRAAEIAYVQIGRQWQPYAEAFLQDLNLSEEDMLRFLIDDSYDDHVRSIFSEIKIEKRDVAPLDLLRQTRRELKDAPQASAIIARVKTLAAIEGGFDDLKKLKFSYLAFAFYAVSSFYRYTKGRPSFNLIYSLTQSPTLDIAKFLNPTEDTTQPPKYSASTHFDFACRICHVYPCYVHGLDSMWDYLPPDPADDIADDEASIEEKLHPFFDTLVNIHRRQRGRRPVRAAQPQQSRPKTDPEFEDRQLYGDPNGQTKARVFFPCNHEGPCEVGVCRCADNGEGTHHQHHHCEKSCGCDASCKRRFKGCRCARKGKICSDELKCPCLRAERECDPDLCGLCGVYESLDPQNCNEDAPFFKERCQNCQIQRNVPRRTLIGESTVHGIGLFAGEDIKKGEYIGEYLGAKMNWKQAERSGLYLLLNGYSYLFDMTGDQTVDAMVLGNKIRFINSIAGKLNCTPKVMMCNTEHRMGLYATKDIPAGEELSFYYGDNFFHNHTSKAERKQGKEKAVGVKSKRGPQIKKRAKKEKVKAAPTIRKAIATAVRPKDDGAAQVEKMAEALKWEGPGLGVDAMHLDDDDSMDEDFEGEDEDEDEESDAIIEDSSVEESEDNAGSRRKELTVIRPRGGRGGRGSRGSRGSRGNGRGRR